MRTKNSSNRLDSLKDVYKSHVLVLWRTIPAQDFNAVRRLEVGTFIGGLATTSSEWQRAVAGDPADAVRIAMRSQIPGSVTFALDVRMTLLLNAALNGSSGASVVLAHLLRKMPLGCAKRNALATSWLVHSFGLRSFAFAKLIEASTKTGAKIVIAQRDRRAS